MPAAKITPEERQYVRDFLTWLAGTYKGGWDKLVIDADVRPSTAQAWRYGDTPTLPSGLELLKILRTAGALREEAMARLSAAEQDAADAVDRSEHLGGTPPHSQEQTG